MSNIKPPTLDSLPSSTKGDLITNDGSENVRLPVGLDGYFLKANSNVTDGIEWDTPGEALAANSANVNNSTVLVSTGLTFTVISTSSHKFRAQLVVTTTAAAALRLALNYSTPVAGDAFWISAYMLDSTGAFDAPTPVLVYGTSVDWNTPLVFATAGATNVVIIEGAFTGLTVGGTITLNFAQGAAAAVNTRVLAGSQLTVNAL